jgi:hypothetical protein
MCGLTNAAGGLLNAPRRPFVNPIRTSGKLYAELAEHWRALAEQTEFLQQYQ